MKLKGTVYLVGAGPGDVGLLTMRGAELLGRAEVVFYDALVNPSLLRLAPKTAEIIYAGKRAKDHAIPQDELNELLVAKAREGKTVVRLKGGDPYVFGRGGEEAEELVAAKIDFEVVPGISSVVAAPNYAGIPITHRDHCSSYTVITGHEDPTKDESNIDWAQVARIPGTKVVLMGVSRIREISGQAGRARHERGGRRWRWCAGARLGGSNRSKARWRALLMWWRKQVHCAGGHGHWRRGEVAQEIELVMRIVRCSASASS